MAGSSGAGTRKGPIRPDTVVDAALALVNLGGLESLTMRRLSDALGTQPPALYRLFQDKDALVDAMADAVLASVFGPLPEANWETRVSVLAGRLRAAMLDQRDGARIVGGAYTTRQPTLTVADSLLAAVKEAGFTGEAAVWAITTVFSYVLGEALEQQGRTEVDVEGVQATLSAEDYPHLARSPLPALLDFDARFVFGLRMLTAGLREGAQTFHSGETVPGAASSGTTDSPTDGTPAPTSRTSPSPSPSPSLSSRKAAPAEPGP